MFAVKKSLQKATVPTFARAFGTAPTEELTKYLKDVHGIWNPNIVHNPT